MLWRKLDYGFIIKNMRKFISNEDWRVLWLSEWGALDDMPDREYLEKLWKAKMGSTLDLNHPETFSEKLQWLKLYDRNPLYTIMADKVEAKKYVAACIGEEYIIPTLGVWDKADEINFDILPEQFVLKCNHNSGLGMYICRNRSELDRAAAIKGLKEGMRQDYYAAFREWPYKDIKRKILAETYITPDDGRELIDYKLMCFNGRVKCSFVCSGRFSAEGLQATYYDRDWKTMPFKAREPRSKYPIEKPVNYEEMIGLAERLSKDIPFVRVDFYEVKGKTYFGEMTFFTEAGYEQFEPVEWNKTLGDWITINKVGD